MPADNYVIRGGREGRERLRVLSEVMGSATRSLLDEAGIQPGWVCADLGCGGGDVTFELAQRVGPTGSVTGFDRDATKVAIAQNEARAKGIVNAEFTVCDLEDWEPDQQFDAAYARFLFSHMAEPARLLSRLHRSLRPGGYIIIEDVDFRGHFSEPHSTAFDRYVDLYMDSVKRRGGNAVIGPLLPGLLLNAGFENVSVRISHPVAMHGGIKTLSCITLESISDAVVADGAIGMDELQSLIAEMQEFCNDLRTVAGGPRVFQVLGRAPASS